MGMTSFIPPSESAAAAATAERDDDEISLTSTLSSTADSDREYEVETILLEEIKDGITYYLIQWVGYALDQCTWEPEENLVGNELQRFWEDKKRKQASGEECAFDRNVWVQAVEHAQIQKQERHKRRNILRKAKGLPMTEPLGSDDDDGKKDSGVLFVNAVKESSEDEAEEELTGLVDSEQSISVHSPPLGRQKIFHGLPTRPHEQTGAKASRQTSPQGRADAARSGVKMPVASSATSVRKTSVPSATVSSSGRPQETGYQGTARKTSEIRHIRTVVPAALHEQISCVSQTTADHTPRPGLAAKTGSNPLKTNRSQRTSVNIFAGGNAIKPRTKFKDTMSDSTKDAKLFTRHHTQRLAYKVGRGKEDAAPDTALLSRLFPISEGPTSSKRAQQPTQAASNLQKLDKPDGVLTLFALEKPAEVVDLTNTSPPRLTEGSASENKRKSVRFDETAPGEDSGPTVSRTAGPTEECNFSSLRKRHRSTPPPTERRPIDAPSPSVPRRKPIPGAKKVSLAEYNAKLYTQNVNKKLKIGASDEVIAIFSGIPKDTGMVWVRAFLEEPTIHFQHSCLAETVLPRASDLSSHPGGRLCQGSVKSPQGTPGSAAVEAIAGNLDKTLRGLLSVHPAYNILLFPAKCLEWQDDMPGCGLEEAAGDVALKFFIFTSEVDLHSTVRPRGLTMLPVPSSHLTPRLLLTQTVFGWDYNRLLPKVDRHAIRSRSQVFFLAFPESRLEVHHSTARWLRENNAACQIYTSQTAGSWQAFWKRLEDDHCVGAVIVHETSVWSLRRFPGLGQRLRGHHKVEYWCFSEPLDPYPLFPSMPVPDHPAASGSANFTRLFPPRVAIFLTPSFLITEPQAASEILEYMNKDWKRMYMRKMVTAHNIYKYLKDVGDTKKSEAEHLRKDSSSNQVQLEIQANLRGVAQTDIENHYRSASVAMELERCRNSFVPDEELGPLLFAPSCIDANDEQSLVNWFGWWATCHMDRYHKFYVIGSNDSMATKNVHQIRLPRYRKDSNGDPDADLLFDAACSQQAEPQQPQPPLVMPAGAKSPALNPGATHNGVSSSWKSRMPWVFRSEILSKEDSMVWKRHLQFLVRRFAGPKTPWILYHFPISWCNSDMAMDYHDMCTNWKTFIFWVAYVRPFSGSKHSYLGLFWTNPDVWEQDETPPPGAPYRRDPWIAIYRPLGANTRKVTQVELIIWDPLAKDRYGDMAGIPQDQLMDMQQRIVQMIDEETPVKNVGARFTRAWVGGWQIPPTCTSTYSIDTTMKFLELVCSDIDRWIPRTGRDLLAQGFRPVHLSSMDSSKRLASANATDSLVYCEPMDLDKPADTADAVAEVDTCLLFHPPRGIPMQPGQRSRCRNKLFESTRIARSRDPQATHMQFAFRPTQEWYQEQRDEGRGFEHVIVDNWKTQFQLLKISGPVEN